MPINPRIPYPSNISIHNTYNREYNNNTYNSEYNNVSIDGDGVITESVGELHGESLTSSESLELHGARIVEISKRNRQKNKTLIEWIPVERNIFISNNKKYKCVKLTNRKYELYILRKDKERKMLLHKLCIDCYQIFKIKKLTPVDNTKHVCRQCLKEYFMCDKCGTFKLTDSKIKSKIDGKTYCKNCFYMKYTICNNCNCQILIHESHIGGINRYCSSCFSSLYGVCSSCGTCVKKNELYMHDNHLHCCNCFKRFSVVKDYTYVPKNFKYKKLGNWENSLYIGIELEVETPDRNPKNFNSWGEEVIQYLKKNRLARHFYLKNDGTIDGFELITQPLTLQFIHKKIPFIKILKWLKDKKFTSYTSGKCGLHVHLNRQFFTNLEIYKIRLFFDTNQSFIYTFSKRKGYGDNFCKYEHLNPSTFIKQGKRQEGKYWALRTNPSGKNTIELRVFRGTLSYPRFLASLQFCDALAHYVKRVGITSCSKKASWISFINWCKKSCRYGHFIKYIENETNLNSSEI